MKGLKKIALVSAIAAAPFAQAELVSMDEASMGNTTGQAGITIDVNSANISIGEIQYQDAGSIFINDFKLAGAGTVQYAGWAKAMLAANPAADVSVTAFETSGLRTTGYNIDNLSINIDVAGTDNTSIKYGMAKVTNTAVAATAKYTSNGSDYTGQAAIDQAALEMDGAAGLISDGDLVIGLDAQDQGTLVDLGIIIGSVVLGEESAATASGRTLAGAGTNTVLLANTALAGAIGPVDIVIDGQNGGMTINAYFGLKGSIELPFVATKFGFKLHNTRGLNSLTADVVTDTGAAYELSGAHFNGVIKADADTAKGISIVVNDFSGDMDITDLTFGSAPAIGDVYITDMVITADLNIYGH